jgi:ABC-type transport system substrate-binding protein
MSAQVVAPEIVDLEFDASTAMTPDALTTFYLVPPSYYAAVPAAVIGRAPRGSGPYRLASWTRERIVLERAGAGSSTGGYNRILWLTDPTSSRRVAMVVEGEADIAPDLDLQDIYRANAANLALVETEDAGNVHALFDARINILAEPRVRRALNLAVDCTRLIQQQYEAKARPLAGVCNGPWENRALRPYASDPVQARTLLEEAGLDYRDGVAYQGDYPLALPILTTPQYEPAARAISQDLKALGITTVVTSLGVTSLDAARKGATPFGLMVRYIGGSASGVGELRWLDSRFRHDVAPGALGTAREFQQDVDALAAAPTREALRAGVAALQEAILEQAPWLFLFRLPRYTACRREVGPLTVAPTGELLIT